jgi:nickel/cobalt exporter
LRRLDRRGVSLSTLSVTPSESFSDLRFFRASVGLEFVSHVGTEPEPDLRGPPPATSIDGATGKPTGYVDPLEGPAALTQILIGSLLLSAIHALIPNHWIPLVAIGRAEGWSRSEILVITGISGLAHVISTILIGVVVGLLGHGLSIRHASVSSVVAPAVLIVLGVVYLVLDATARRRHQHRFPARKHATKVSRFALVASLCLAMFFSPCIEIEAYFFSAGIIGWHGIVAVSLVYLVLTVMGMVILVDLGLKGAARIRSRFLERHEKRVTGLLLVALGVLAHFVKL